MRNREWTLKTLGACGLKRTRKRKTNPWMFKPGLKNSWRTKIGQNRLKWSEGSQITCRSKCSSEIGWLETFTGKKLTLVTLAGAADIVAVAEDIAEAVAVAVEDAVAVEEDITHRGHKVMDTVATIRVKRVKAKAKARPNLKAKNNKKIM